MASIGPGVLTALFARARGGDDAAVEEIANIVYPPLREQAGKLVADGAVDTIHPTSLVHDALGELLKDKVFWQSPDRRYFFKAASNTLRQLAVDRARRLRAQKRGHGWKRVRLDQVIQRIEALEVDILSLDDALIELEKHDPRMAEVVQLKFFVGLTNPEIAHQLDASLSTIKSDWKLAKLWLYKRLHCPD